MNRSLHIAFVATECVPFLKVGGLADVVGSLPKALEECGLRVDVIIPLESSVGARAAPQALERLRVDTGSQEVTASVHWTTLPGSNVRVFMIEDGKYFPRGSIYVDPSTGSDYPDQAERWVFFQKAALALLARECPDVDVIHCHEHQAALIPAYLEHSYRSSHAFSRTSTVLTIHNLGYQGIFPLANESIVGLPEAHSRAGGSLEFYGQLNFMKCGILTADAVTVVSPTYAKEIQTQEFGFGLDGVISERRSDLFGILNGIDEVEWNPETDFRIHSRYSPSDLRGKELNRSDLIRSFALSAGVEGPVLAMVSRIDAHKGFGLVLPVLEDLLPEPMRFLLVGTGDPTIAAQLEGMAAQHRDRVGIRFAFDNELAHQVIAGADIFLMPSRYEPCGLTQMYALRYGTVPVVRATGGLADTVQEFIPETGIGTGFTFSEYSANAFRRAIERAIDVWNSPHWPTIMRNGMQRDFSWNASARQFLEVYEHAMNKS